MGDAVAGEKGLLFEEKMSKNGDEYKLAESHTMDMIISPSKNEDDEFNFKLLYKEERIFDGFFYLARIIRRFAREIIPAKIENSLSSFQESHAETVNYLSNVV